MPPASERLTQFTREGLTFDVRDTGPLDSTEVPVVLLHGFPQSSAAWSGVQPILAEAGLRSIAPDQRGYSPGARPQGRSAYRIGELGRDIVALIDALGVEQAHVVGHDWGGGVAWHLGMRHPDRLASLTVLSTPHPEALVWALRHSDQLRRSWYMLAMQVPALPERRMADLMRDGGLERMGLDPEHAHSYADLLLQPGALTAAINWYRGMFARAPKRSTSSTAGQATTSTPSTGSQRSGSPRRSPVVEVPVTYLWGRDDPHLGRAAAERSSLYCHGDYEFHELNAGHWLPETRPDEISRHIINNCRSMSD